MELPQEFKERVKKQLGESYGQFLAGYEKERAYGLRVNTLKTDENSLRSALFADGIALEKVPWAEQGYYYCADAHPGKLPLHEAGAYYIQEPSAMIAAELLEPQPGEKILDLCAAPGGKSTQIAARMQGKGLLVSNEVILQRAKTLSRNIERMGVWNAVVLNETPGRLAQCFPLFFDRIIVDAPCSGEGMFRKDVQARGEWSPAQVELCAKRQRDILAQAAWMLKPGGVLVYSTCTFAPQENEQNAAWFVRQYPQFVLEKEEQIWPHLQRGEGHYAARFRKQGSAAKKGGQNAAADSSKRQPKTAAMRKQKSEMQMALRYLSEFCAEALSDEKKDIIMERASRGQLAMFGDQLYLLPPEMISLDGLKTERAGLQLGCCRKNRFEPSHALAMALRPSDVTQVCELEQPQRFIKGETIACAAQKGWTLAAVNGCSLGWGKASGGVLKNHYPKGLRKNESQ